MCRALKFGSENVDAFWSPIPPTRRAEAEVVIATAKSAARHERTTSRRMLDPLPARVDDESSSGRKHDKQTPVAPSCRLILLVWMSTTGFWDPIRSPGACST